MDGHKVWQLSSDLNDKSAVMEEVKSVKPTHILHLAAISSVTHSDEAAFYSVNVLGTMNLLDAASSLATSPKVLLASSANVYGNDASPISEAQTTAPVNHYAMKASDGTHGANLC